MNPEDDEFYKEMADLIFKRRYGKEKGIDLELFVSEIYSFTFAYIKYASVHMGNVKNTLQFLNEVVDLMSISAHEVVHEIYKPEVERLSKVIEEHVKEGRLK